MFEVQFFIPAAGNDGVTFTEKQHADFEREVIERFKGVSLLPGTVEGQWMDASRSVFSDTLRVYVIAVPSITLGHKIGELAEIAKQLYLQKAVTVRYLGQMEIL